MKRILASIIWKVWHFGWNKLGYNMVLAEPKQKEKKHEEPVAR